MKATNAVIGGEGNGGVIYPALHYGRDALVGIALFLTHLARHSGPVSALRDTYPSYHISKNKIKLSPDMDIDGLLRQIRDRYRDQPINPTDGVRRSEDRRVGNKCVST